jgi:hypothetical protein
LLEVRELVGEGVEAFGFHEGPDYSGEAISPANL